MPPLRAIDGYDAAMLGTLALTLILHATAQAGTEDPPSAVPVRDRAATEPEAKIPAPGPLAEVPRFEFESFGAAKPLARAERVVLVRVTSVHNLMGIGTSVTRCEVRETLLPVAERKPPEEVVVLATHGDFRPGAEYILFLVRFRGGDRYVSLARIAAGDRDFAAKRRVLGAFAELDRLPSESERLRRIRDVLLRHLEDEDSFVRWNAIAEWKALARFAKDRPDLVGADHRAALVKRLREERVTAVREALAEILTMLGVDPAAAATDSSTDKDP